MRDDKHLVLQFIEPDGSMALRIEGTDKLVFWLLSQVGGIEGIKNHGS